MNDLLPRSFLRSCLGLLIIAPLLAASPATAGPVQVKVTQVTASSDGTSNPQKWPHNPLMAVDGNTKTCWASSPNDTIGAWLKFNFDGPRNIAQIQIVNGWIPEGYPNFFTQNHRLKKITLLYGNGKKEAFELRDNNDIQILSPAFADKTKSVTLRVDAIYPADSSSSNAWVTVSEVTFFSEAEATKTAP
ncbi:MAG: discoidin domain-containing protein [Opitutaceae bacterium]|jgi:hypothetical protein